MPPSENTGVGQLSADKVQVERPKRVEISEVANGFTVNFWGGKIEAHPFRVGLKIASTVDEAIELAKEHLA